MIPKSLNEDQAPRNEYWHHMYNADVISMPLWVLLVNAYILVVDLCQRPFEE